MSITDIARKAQEIKELERMAEDLAAEINALKDSIKEGMGEKEQVVAGQYKITWRAITSARLDTKALQAALPEVAQRFTITNTTRRFVIA